MNKIKSAASSQGGFIKLIILIVIVYFTMRYYHLTVSGIIDSVLLYIKKFPLLDKLVQEIIKGFNALIDNVKNS
jgi:hypothetical protein